MARLSIGDAQNFGYRYRLAVLFHLDIVQQYPVCFILRTFFPLSQQPAANYAKVIIQAKFFSGHSNILCLPRSLPLEPGAYH